MAKLFYRHVAASIKTIVSFKNINDRVISINPHDNFCKQHLITKHVNRLETVLPESLCNKVKLQKLYAYISSVLLNDRFFLTVRSHHCTLRTVPYAARSTYIMDNISTTL